MKWLIAVGFVWSLGFINEIQAEVTKPKGVYASAGAMTPAVVGNDNVRGVLIRAKWSDIEISEGHFDFTAIDRQVSPAKAAGKKWSLGVLAGTFAPSWLWSGQDVVTFPAFGGTLAVWWNTRVTDRLRVLAQALADKYGSDTSLALVYVSQMTCNGIEGHFNGVPQSTLIGAGYTVDNFVEAAETTARDFADAFPGKPLAVEYHEILHSNEHASRMMTDLWNDTNLAQRVGAAIWWIDGATNYQPNLLTVLQNFPGDKYAQLIDKSSKLAAFPDGYTAVFDQAKSLGVRYIEPWDYEFVNNLWDSTFQDFNTWTDSVFQ